MNGDNFKIGINLSPKFFGAFLTFANNADKFLNELNNDTKLINKLHFSIS